MCTVIITAYLHIKHIICFGWAGLLVCQLPQCQNPTVSFVFMSYFGHAFTEKPVETETDIKKQKKMETWICWSKSCITLTVCGWRRRTYSSFTWVCKLIYTNFTTVFVPQRISVSGIIVVSLLSALTLTVNSCGCFEIYDAALDFHFF